MKNSAIKFLVSTGVAAFVALIIGGSSFYTVPEGFRSVITRNGAVVDEAGPGLHFKTPIIEQAHDMSVQSTRWTFDKLAAYSRDIQQANVSISVMVRLNPDAVKTMYSTVGQDWANTMLGGAVPQALKEVFGQYSAASIIGEREAISRGIASKLSDTLAGRGLVIEQVQIENIDFSDAYEQAAEAAAKAQADVLKAKQELEQTKVNAQRQVAEADAKAQATMATADAEAYATKAKGEAEAAALAARGKALNDNPKIIDLITVERWQGQVPTTMVPGAAVPFVNVK